MVCAHGFACVFTRIYRLVDVGAFVCCAFIFSVLLGLVGRIHWTIVRSLWTLDSRYGVGSTVLVEHHAIIRDSLMSLLSLNSF